MNINIERGIWLTVCAACVITTTSLYNTNRTKDTVIDTYNASTSIERAMILDLTNQIQIVSSNEYSRGFEAGRTSTGVAMMEGNSMMNYSDGYHAALWQYVDDTTSIPSDAIVDKAIDDIVNSISTHNDVDLSATSATNE